MLDGIDTFLYVVDEFDEGWRFILKLNTNQGYP